LALPRPVTHHRPPPGSSFPRSPPRQRLGRGTLRCRLLLSLAPRPFPPTFRRWSHFGHQGFGSWRNAASEASGVSDLVAAAGDCRTFISGPKGTTQVGLIGVSCSMSKSTTEAKGGSLLVAMIQKFVPTAASWMHRSIVGTQTSPYVTSSVDLQYLAASGISNLVIQARGFT
jgi:hypothetical protein